MPAKDRLIPPYISENRQLPPAMIDHTEIVIGDWPVRGSVRDDVLRFLRAVPEIEAITKDGVVVPVFVSPTMGEEGRWFNAAVYRGARGNVTYRTRPIFGGSLATAKGAPRVPRNTPGEHIRLGLEAHLNVNLYLMAQAIRRRQRFHTPRLETPLATAIEGEHAEYDTEHCLTDDMNLVIGPAYLYRYVLSKPAEDHFMDYLRLIETFITAQLRATAGSYGVRLDHSPYFSLRKIEFTWEFSHPNPIRFVESLEVPMRALGSSSRRHRALVRGESFRVEQDSLSISVELSAGCNLIVYAKTNERVRFEVRLDQYAIGTMLGKGQEDAGRTASNHEDLRQKIATLREGATERLQAALVMLGRQLTPPASDMTAVRLCAEVGRILQNDSLAHTVLETLRMRGSLASAHRSAMRGAADKLMASDVLRRLAPRSAVFVPTDRYVRAVRELRRVKFRRSKAPTPARDAELDDVRPRGGIRRRRNLPRRD